MIEKLESRRMLAAASVTFSNGLLTIKGGSQSDNIVVVEKEPASDPSNVHVEVSTPARNFFYTNDFSGVTGITIIAGGKPDRIFHTGNRIHPKIYGNSGNDDLTITDNGTGSSYVDAGSGDDQITLLVGTVNPPGTTATTLHGGDGKDTIFVNTDNSGAYDVANSHVLVFGDKGDDSITLYDGMNTVSGDGGNDRYFVNGGTNTITDSGGTNTYTIGNAFHSVAGGVNNITGGGGTDTFNAYDGLNTLNAGNGNDFFYTYGGSGSINGGSGTDTRYDGGGIYSETSIEKHFLI